MNASHKFTRTRTVFGLERGNEDAHVKNVMAQEVEISQIFEKVMTMVSPLTRKSSFPEDLAKLQLCKFKSVHAFIRP